METSARAAPVTTIAEPDFVGSWQSLRRAARVSSRRGDLHLPSYLCHRAGDGFGAALGVRSTETGGQCVHHAYE